MLNNNKPIKEVYKNPYQVLSDEAEALFGLIAVSKYCSKINNSCEGCMFVVKDEDGYDSCSAERTDLVYKEDIGKLLSNIKMSKEDNDLFYKLVGLKGWIKLLLNHIKNDENHEEYEEAIKLAVTLMEEKTKQLLIMKKYCDMSESENV